MTILAFQHAQCLHLMYAEVSWAVVSLGTQVQPQITIDLDYFPGYSSVSYDYAFDKPIGIEFIWRFLSKLAIIQQLNSFFIFIISRYFCYIESEQNNRTRINSMAVLIWSLRWFINMMYLTTSSWQVLLIRGLGFYCLWFYYWLG